VKNDPAPAMVDSPHRCREAHLFLAELLCHQQRNSLRAAVEAVLLGAAVGAEQGVEAAARACVEKDVQQ
jgi:hypothetical protein